ncbi:hypothetical protein D3C84_719980 [compost metagenome]
MYVILGHTQLQVDRVAVLVTAGDLAAGADNVSLTGDQIARDMAVVLPAQRIVHQAGNVLPEQLLRRVAEQRLDGRGDALHDAAAVDGDYAFEQVVEDCTDLLLLGVQLGQRLAAFLDPLL